MTGKAHTNAVSALACAFPVIRNLTVLRPTVFAVSRYENSVSQCPIELRSCSQHASMPSRFMSINECGLAPVHPHVREGGGVRSGPGEARTILLLHIISVRPSKQPLMVRTFLKVYNIHGARLLFFVSARTNKRHHHHPLTLHTVLVLGHENDKGRQGVGMQRVHVSNSFVTLI
jgi:hypothetical protein